MALESHLEQYKKNVFICHQKEDIDVVRQIVDRLKNNKINTWVDYENLTPGMDWAQKINEEIKHTDAVIVCLSKLAHEKEGFFHQEIDYALQRIKRLPPKKRTFIMPILIDEGAEAYPPLEDYQHVSIDSISDGVWFEKLLESLGIDKQEEFIYSIERQKVLVDIEKLKLELVECWLERNKHSKSNRKWRDLEQQALNIVTHIHELCEKIGQNFRPETLYRRVKFADDIKTNDPIRELQALKYSHPHAVLVPKKHVGDILFLVEKGNRPRQSVSSKRVSQFEESGVICGYAMFYSYATQTGAIEPGKKYHVYDSEVDEHAYLIGEFET